MASTMSLIGEQTITEGRLRGDATRYSLFWRARPNHPWHSHEFDSRERAYHRYFALIERGVEAYLQRRRPSVAE